MEEKIVYFENPGKENTAEVIELVLEKAKSRNINRIVLASTRGYTAKAFLDAVEGKDINLVVVPWQFNLKEEGNPFPQELVKELQEKKHVIHFGTMLFDTNDLYGTNTRGCIKMGEKVLVVAGTHSGADFAVVATAASSTNVKSLKINEIICKPIC